MPAEGSAPEQVWQGGDQLRKSGIDFAFHPRVGQQRRESLKNIEFSP
jgi:hypothetical protein